MGAWRSLLQSRTARAFLALEARLLHSFHRWLFANAGEELGKNRAMQSRGGRGLVAGLELVTANFHFQIVRKDSSHFRHFLGLLPRLLIEIPRRDGGILGPVLHWCGILMCKHRRACLSCRSVRPQFALALGSASLHGNRESSTCVSPSSSWCTPLWTEGHSPQCKQFLKVFSCRGWIFWDD